jgi:dipeptidyl aminopeptidase/acylaminoacyl peptidase
MRVLNPGDVHDVPTDYPTDPIGCGCDISPDGKELAFTENVDAAPAVSTSVSIFTLDLTNPAAKPVKVSTSAGGNFDPAYSPDGKYLAWRSQERAGYESDHFGLIVYDRGATRHGDPMPLPVFGIAKTRYIGMTPGYIIGDNWVDEFAWALDSESIFVASGIQGKTVIVKAQFELAGFPFIFQPQEGAVWSDVHPLPKNRLVATEMSAGRPAEIVTLETIFTPGSNPYTKSTPVTHLNDALLAQLDLPKIESFWFTAKDGTKLEGFLIRPPGFDPAKKYPVKFLIHGGPEGNWGDDWSYRWNAELFAANGYVVIMINPRGSTGYGQAIVDGVNGDWGGKPFTDLMEGLDYAEQHYPFIDKDRECALGASYGGYMANWVLGHTNRFKCIVSHDGVFDAESAFGTTEEDWFNIWEFKGHPWDYYGKPDAENPYRKFSPSLYAKNFKTPTLVVHGQLDYRLDVSEGFQLFDTLQMLGVPSKMLYFPDEGHWVMKPQNSQLWYKTVNDWVDEWVKKN